MNETRELLTKGGFTAADILQYIQTMAEEYADAYQIGEDWTDNDINYDDCEEIALDRLADYAYNYSNTEPMQEHLKAYCGSCTQEQAQAVINAVKSTYGERI